MAVWNGYSIIGMLPYETELRHRNIFMNEIVILNIFLFLSFIFVHVGSVGRFVFNSFR